MRIHPSNLINAIKNIKNWFEYALHKRDVRKHTMIFTAKPYAIKMEVDAGNYSVFKEIFIEDFYKIKQILKGLPAALTIIDIGANEGFFAAMILSKTKQAVIHAYEPLPDNVNKIKRLIEINPSVSGKIVLNNAAVSDGKLKTLKLFIQKENSESSTASILEDFDARNISSIEVASTSLEEIFIKNNLNEVHLLKMDCEGAEYPILYSAPVNILKKIKRILAEVHLLDNNTRNVDHLAKYLEGNGFKISTSLFNNGCYYMIAVQ